MLRGCAIHAIMTSDGRGGLQSVNIGKICNMPKGNARDVTLITIIKLSGKNKK